MPSRRAPEEANLYARGNAIYFRFRAAGVDGPVDINQSLGRIDWPTARIVRDLLITTLNGRVMCAKLGIEPTVLDPRQASLLEQFGLEAMLQRLGVIAQRSDLATIGQVLAAFEADAPGRSTIGERAAHDVPLALRRLVREVKGEGFDVDAAPVSLLTAALCDDYKAQRVAAAKAQGPAAVRRALTTIASTHAQARSVFADDATRQPRMRRLVLPDLTGFRTWKSGGTTRKRRKPMDDGTVARLRDAIDGLWFSDPIAWLGIVLCANIGLRRGDAVMARWDWVRMVDGQPLLINTADDEHRPKAEDYEVIIPLPLWQDMLVHRTEACPYIIPYEQRARRDRVFTANVQWLRRFGWEIKDINKPTHELRAVLLQQVRKRRGMDDAQALGGHTDASTTRIYTGTEPGRGERW